MIETIQETGQKGIARAGGVLMYIFRDHRDHLLHAVFLNETAGSIQLYHHFLEKFTQHPGSLFRRVCAGDFQRFLLVRCVEICQFQHGPVFFDGHLIVPASIQRQKSSLLMQLPVDFRESKIHGADGRSLGVCVDLL